MNPHPTAPGSERPPVHLSIVIPVFNEQDRIVRCLREVSAWCDNLNRTAEVIVVDDGSSDGTVEIAFAHAATDPRVQVLQEQHHGKAHAVLAGLRRARGEFSGFCDVDLATPLDTWFACEERLRGGAGVAIASREGHGAVRVGEPGYRHAMGRVFNALIRLLLLPGIHDTQCGFKFFTREALEQILPRTRLYANTTAITRPRVTAFDVELLFIARRRGIEIAVIPVTWHYGEHTKVSPVSDTIQNLGDVLRVRWNGWRGRYD